MKKSKTVISIILVSAMLILASCTAAPSPSDYYNPINGNSDGKASYEYPSISEKPAMEQIGNYDKEKKGIVENQFIKTSENAVSTFSADVDTASYTLLRRLLKNNYSLDEIISTAGDSIRTEELVNYFKYDYKKPAENELFGVSCKLTPCPWNEESSLLTLGLQTEVPDKRLPNNLVFLIDISGSMYSEDKLPLLQRTFSYLTSNLTAEDTVSVVTYAAGEKTVLEGCAGNKADMIQSAINSLRAEGSTNGEAGLKKAYELAEKYYKPNGNNRIILASDGDLNVGMSSVDEIEKFVAEKRGQGVYISVLGFGYGNYRDSIMETIADKGNGVYYYIDGEEEAEKIFGTDLLSTLYTVASDVKLQITFDSENVAEYRLIGYENRVMNEEDFKNDTKDAGELGAGHSVTVCYELKLKEGNETENEGLFDLSVRYKKPGEEKSVQNDYRFNLSITSDPDADSDLIAALCELGMILHNSEYGKNLTLDDVCLLLEGHDYGSDQYKAQFAQMIKELRIQN
ncbi:MAG: von Willebrand factor type A domain-containing protein [Clostridia bacterium]|nr:von Willebrand factor type A domain-containing protein [Clostridia bacterium]